MGGGHSTAGTTTTQNTTATIIPTAKESVNVVDHLNNNSQLLHDLSSTYNNNPEEFDHALKLIQNNAKLQHAREELPLGRRFMLNTGLCGTVRYVGPPPGKLNDACHQGHIFVFLELEGPYGNSNGNVGGITLVEGIQPKHGICVEREHVTVAAPELSVLRQKSAAIHENGDSNKIISIQSKIRQRQASSKAHKKRCTEENSSSSSSSSNSNSNSSNNNKSNSEEIKRNYKKIDNHALRAPKSARNSLQSLVNYLIEPDFVQTEEERARAIFRWCTDNIEYDFESYHSGNYGRSQGPENVLKTGKGVCSGYAGLVQALMDLASVKCVTLSGIAKAAGYNINMTTRDLKSNHAWNAIQINNQWKLLETTWASGSGSGSGDTRHFQKSFDNSWWCTDPKTFLYKHFPLQCKYYKNNSEPAEKKVHFWQLIEKPVTKDEFAEMPFVRPNFSNYGVHFNERSISNTRQIHYRVVDNKPLILEFHCPVTTSIIGGVNKQTKGGGNSKQSKDCWSLQRKPIGSSNICLYVSFPSNGTYIVHLYGKPSTRTGSYDELHKVLVRVNGIHKVDDGGSTSSTSQLPVEVDEKALHCGLRVNSHTTGSIVYDSNMNTKPLIITLHCPENMEMLSNLKILMNNNSNTKKEKKMNEYTMIHKDPYNPTNVSIVTKFPTSGMYVITIFYKLHSSTKSTFSYATKYNVKVHAMTIGCLKFPILYGSSKTNKLFSILQPLPWDGSMKVGSKVQLVVICKGEGNGDEYSGLLKIQIFGQWMDRTMSSIGDGKYEIEVDVPNDISQDDCKKDGIVLYERISKADGVYSYNALCKWNAD
jgi:hypothetical protein